MNVVVVPAPAALLLIPIVVEAIAVIEIIYYIDPCGLVPARDKCERSNKLKRPDTE